MTQLGPVWGATAQVGPKTGPMSEHGAASQKRLETAVKTHGMSGWAQLGPGPTWEVGPNLGLSGGPRLAKWILSWSHATHMSCPTWRNLGSIWWQVGPA